MHMTSTPSAATKKPLHPATSEIVYTKRQIAYMEAVQAFKSATGRKFPTLCDMLAIADKLGSEN